MNRLVGEIECTGPEATPERDRSQIPLWPELEQEFEAGLAAGQSGDAGPVVEPDALAAVAEPDAGVDSEMQAVMDDAQERAIRTPEATSDQSVATSGTAQGQTPARVTHPVEQRMDARGWVEGDADAELGQRLRAAREVAGLGSVEIARRTRIAPTLILAIESGQFTRLGAQVFVRGYLRSYAREVGVPDAVIASWEARSQRLCETIPAASMAAATPKRATRQFASPIVYTLLTVLIAVPAWYGVKQARHSPLLSSSAAADPDAAGSAPGGLASVPGTDRASSQPAAVPSGTVATPAPQGYAQGGIERAFVATTQPDSVPDLAGWKQPVMASLTPMLEAPRESDPLPSPLDVRTLEFRLSAPSWIEIVAADGRVIERGLLPADSMREYVVPVSARVRVGDVDAVELRADGKVIDLGPHARANVATLTLDEAG